MTKRRYALLAIVLILIVLVVVIYKKHHPGPDTSSVTIILSPHADDAVLSLGGLLARNDRLAVVATFFTAIPSTATSTRWDTRSGFDNSTDAENARIQENNKALTGLGATIKNYDYLDKQYGYPESDTDTEADIAEDIQTLIASYSNKTIYVYGPSTFVPGVTHPDHSILHKAFLDVANGYPLKNVHFYFYEDYPYIDRFNKVAVISLEKNLENDSGLLLNRVNIPLTNEEVGVKIKALKEYSSQVKAFDTDGSDVVQSDNAYTENRCGTNMPCEAVYEIIQ